MYRVRRHIEIGIFGGCVSLDGVLVDWAFAKRFRGGVFFRKQSGAEIGQF